jgi:hypothetical protein
MTIDTAALHTVARPFRADREYAIGEMVIPSEMGIQPRRLGQMIDCRLLAPVEDDNSPPAPASEPYRHGKRKGKRRG